MSSVLISIESCLHHLDDEQFSNCGELRIGLRNIKALVLCLRKLGYDKDLGCPLLKRIKDHIARLVNDHLSFDEHWDSFKFVKVMEVEVHYMEKEMDDLYSSMSNQESRSGCLTTDTAVKIADCILENIVEFLHLWNDGVEQGQLEVMDALEVQVVFFRDVLIFAFMHSDIEQGHFENLLIHAEPFAITAVRVFINHRIDRNSWYVEVLSKLSKMNIGVVDPLLYKAYTQVLSSSRTLLRSRGVDCGTLANFLDSLMSVLWDMLRLDACHLVCAKDQMQVVYEGLRFCRSLLRQWSDLLYKIQIAVWICDAGVFVCSLQLANVKIDDQLSNLLETLHAIQGGNKNGPSQASMSLVMKTNMSNSSHGNDKYNTIDQAETRIWSHQHPQSTPIMTNGVVGLDDEINSIIDRLVRGSKSLRVVAICGMAGIGKTTLASMVFNHSVVNHHFHARGWCSVSQVLDKKKVLVELLSQIDPSTESNGEKTGNNLADQLRRSLKGKRYLIFLDDVWTTEAWESLKISFPNDSTQSRIILTSRQYSIAPCGLLDQKPHSLPLRQDYQSLKMMQMRLFPGKGWPQELMELGMQIAEKCKGLPMTVVIVTGLLATTEQQDWKGILEAISTDGVSSKEQCNISLELSYKHLPHELKQCLLYFAAFPEDEKISVRRLIRLWIAESFVDNIKSERMEDVAREYLNNLIQRSLVMVAENRSLGGVKTCQIHDLLHGFCLQKAKEENFLHLLQGQVQLSDFSEPRNLRRLCVHSEPVHLKKSKLFCPRAHSMLFFNTAQSGSSVFMFHMSFIIQIFKLLNVLEIGQVYLDTGVPSEIELLTLLRYLSLKTKVGILPSSLGNLSNLETLIASLWKSEISLPHTFWNLRRLKYLSIHGRFGSCVLPLEDVENPELETLGRVSYYLDGSMEKRMRNFPNITKLECKIHGGQEGTERFNQIVVLDFLSRLESLTIMLSGDRFCCEFVLPECLRKLKLAGDFMLSRRELSVLGKLPKLEVLKLESIHFLDTLVMEEEESSAADALEIEEGEFSYGYTLEMEKEELSAGYTLEMDEGEFSALKYLKLYNLEIWSWTASDEQLPCLQKLILKGCSVLREIPSCLEMISTLEEVDVCRCPSDLVRLVQQVEEVHMEYGKPIVVRIVDTLY